MQNEDKNGFLDYFEDFKDHRIDRNKLYPINEILLVAILTVICGGEGWKDMEMFGNAKIEFLRQFLPFENGIPTADTFRRFFRRIDTNEFNIRFASWMSQLPLKNGATIAIDGKVSRHTFDGESNSAIHTVSAFATETRMVLAQTNVNEKSNEINSIPVLLDLINIKGAIVTIDAMGWLC